MASTQTPAQNPAEQAQAPGKDQKATPALEEDDEFEDFPVEGTYSLTFCNLARAFKPGIAAMVARWFQEDAHVHVASWSATRRITPRSLLKQPRARVLPSFSEAAYLELMLMM